jgi:ferredoxin
MSEKSLKILRWIVRIFILLVACFLLFPGNLPKWLGAYTPSFLENDFGEVIIFPPAGARAVPHASPLVYIHSIIAGRSFFAAFLWSIVPLLMLLLAMWKGRFFCKWICPLGTLYGIASSVSAKKTIWKHRISGYIFWICFFSALLGVPLLLWLDPLSTFNRMGVLAKGVFTAAALVPAGIVALFLILSFIQPILWCSHFCPLGYFLGLLKVKGPSLKLRFNARRREIITGIVGGVAGFSALKILASVKKDEKKYPVLPPGAVAADDFSSLCIRCYACVNVCPTRILGVDFPKDGDILRWFEPEMNPRRGVCDQYCNKCSDNVCPVGAIEFLTIEEKQKRQIGIAEVIRSTCLAWEHNEHCMVCDEYCPYGAIDNDESKDGIPRPVVKPDLCRGCGACQNACPAKGAPAIVVKGLKEQKTIR